MTNYLLSIDPSIKNTGFTLWEKTEYHQRCIGDCIKYGMICECEISNNHYEWKPIWINSYNFEDYFNLEFLNSYVDEIKNIIWNYLDSKAVNWMNFLDLIIERGTFHVKNGIGYETQEHLRGFIAGTFNKLLIKDMLISPSKWKKWYIDNYPVYCWGVKWTKEKSLEIAQIIITENNWNIKINNHDEADSLLIGWYYLNKENK